MLPAQYKLQLERLFLISICFLILLTSCKNEHLQEPKHILTSSNNNTLKVNIERDTIKAGQNLDIEIANVYTEAFVLIENTMMSSIIAIEKNKEFQVIHLDSSYTNQTGALNIKLIAESQKIYESKIEILPLKPYKFIESYLGPRGVIVKSGEPVMTVAIPTDKYDNPIAKGSLVTYKYQRPNGIKQNFDTKTAHLLTFHEISPQQKTGKTLIGVSCLGANTNEKEFDEEPDWAHNISIDEVDYQGIADARQFFKVRTNPIKDQYGNLISNGTEVSFYIINQEGRVSIYRTLSINGEAEAIIQNPPITSNWEVYATCGYVKSESKKLSFQRCVKDFEVVFDKEKGEVIAGEMLSYLEQYIPDASPIVFQFYENENLIVNAERPSIKGFATLKLNDILLKKGHYRVVINAYEAKGVLEFDF